MIRSLRIIIEILLQKIRKEENFKDGKHDKKLDCKNNQKTFTRNAYIPESVNINSV